VTQLDPRTTKYNDEWGPEQFRKALEDETLSFLCFDGGHLCHTCAKANGLCFDTINRIIVAIEDRQWFAICAIAPADLEKGARCDHCYKHLGE
jgi:hypothetical protein